MQGLINPSAFIDQNHLKPVLSKESNLIYKLRLKVADLLSQFILKSLQMYVPGTLENTTSVLVNIGTGYFVEKVHIRKLFFPLDAINHWKVSILFWLVHFNAAYKLPLAFFSNTVLTDFSAIFFELKLFSFSQKNRNSKFKGFLAFTLSMSYLFLCFIFLCYI